jgi:hypothetical protein
MKLLWVHRDNPDPGAGDNIFDRKMVEHLRRRHDVATLPARRNPRVRQLGEALAHVSTPDTFGYGGEADIRAIEEALATGVDALVFSHEYLDRVAWRLKARAVSHGVRMVSIRHNVTSDAMASILSHQPLLARAYCMRAQAQERRALRPGLYDAIATLSARDRRLVSGLSGRSDIGLVIPGAPPPSPLAPTATVRRDLVLLGTFDWFPKAQDLRRFRSEYAGLAEKPGPLYAETGAAAQFDRPIDFDWSEAVRFGLVTDRFAAGHKLKTAAYLMNNCAVISFAPVAEDFAFSPHAQSFIRQINHAREIAGVIASLEAMPADALRRDLEAFKRAIAENLSWARQAEALCGLIAGLIPARPLHAAS